MAVGLLAVAACGRFDFAPIETRAQDATGDATPFAPTSNACGAAATGPFVPVANFPTTGGGYGVWSQAPYLVEADTTGGLHSLTLDGGGFTEHGHLEGLGWVEAVVGDGTHYYVSAPGTGFYVVELGADGSLALAGSDLSISEARHAWFVGSTIYVPVGGDGVHAVRFDGTAISEVGTKTSSHGFSQSVVADASYIYLADNDVLRILTFDGAAFTDVAQASDHPGYSRVWVAGSTVFAATTEGAVAMKWDGTTLATLDLFPTAAQGRDVWFDGQHVFFAAQEDGLYALAWDGAHFTKLDHVPSVQQTLGVFGDGTFIYVNDFAGGLTAYSGFRCSSF